MMNRRTFVAVLLATTALPFEAKAQTAEIPAVQASYGPPQPFSAERVTEMARALAADAFVPAPEVPKLWLDLEYPQYRNINFDRRSSVWAGEDPATTGPFEFDLFAPGLYFRNGVDVFTVEAGSAREIVFDPSLFTMGDKVPEAVRTSRDPSLGFSGFRMRTPINSTERRDEFVVFQGASYFRAVGRDQFYGLSARGLALGTGGADGEEFPFFKAFWIEKPDAGAESVTVHALMDSTSVAGAYTFEVKPGDATVMDVRARLFPRMDLDQIGIAPATSMFLFDETNRLRFPDFRPSVHDSDGLMMHNGAGELLWRKLANPVDLQISSFVDDNPRGFGLMQRARRLSDFADLEARYEKRPGLWVEPEGEWGAGTVMLVEIPADKEIYDNIVAFWRPREPLAAGQEHDFSYRLSWGTDFETTDPRLRVQNTYLGAQPFDEKPNARTVAIDYVPPEGAPVPDARLVEVHVSSDRGEVAPGTVVPNPETGGLRLAFNFYADEPTELRAQLLKGRKPISEVWLYRWTPS